MDWKESLVWLLSRPSVVYVVHRPIVELGTEDSCVLSAHTDDTANSLYVKDLLTVSRLTTAPCGKEAMVRTLTSLNHCSSTAICVLSGTRARGTANCL